MISAKIVGNYQRMDAIMDFDIIANSMGAMTCVISVDKLPDGKYENIRLVAGNKAYIASLENPIEELNIAERKFIPNSLYTEYLPQDLNFEYAVYQAAVNKKVLHSYVKPDRHDVWINMVFMPLMADEGNTCYCTYTMELDLEPDSESIADVSGDIAGAVLETCVVLRSNNDFQKAMDEVVKSIRKMCDAEMCVVLLVDHADQRCRVLSEDKSEDTKLKSFGFHIDRGFYEVVATWGDTISGSNCLIIKDENDMEYLRTKNAPWQESLVNEGIKTLVIFPLKSGDEIIGYVWADNFPAASATRIKETLEVTTFILSSEISNYLLLDRLETLSSRDMLTGVFNRNEMNNVVDRFSQLSDKTGDSLGVIFADLNGLKTVNDIQGHSAGDQLIKKAATLLSEVFSNGRVYRAGGDEFSIIMDNTSEEEVAKKILVLRTRAMEQDVSLAVGSCVVSDYRDIRIALRIADERMYIDKAKYYEAHPEKKR